MTDAEHADLSRRLALAKRRAAHEASAAAHYAATWYDAHQWHLTRHSAMCELIDLVFADINAETRVVVGARG